ncbi:hypothetical protein [Cryptosporangium minutisporangium]|uniref:hypothetical protein n=1 Tax=Cryptosporangium minutisporangium TaxID=113569 RepID=UPI0031E84A08
MPDVYSGSGPGDVRFDPSGRYAAIEGDLEPNGFPTSTTLLDLTTGEATQITHSETCGGIPLIVFATDSRTLIQRECERARLRKHTPEGWESTGANLALDDAENIWALSADGRILTYGRNRLRIRSATTGALLGDHPVPREITADELNGATGTFDGENRPLFLTSSGVWLLGSTEPPRRYAPARCPVSCETSLAGQSPDMIAWTIQGTSPAEGAPQLWTLDHTGTITARGTVTGGATPDYLNFFLADRLLRPGPDFLRTPQLRV